MNTDPNKKNITAPNEGPSQRDEVQQEIERFKLEKEQSEKDSRNFSQASTSTITTNEEDIKKQEEAQRKKMVLESMISQQIDKALIPISGQLEQIPQLINTSIQNIFNQYAAQQGAAQVPQEVGGAAAAMNPEMMPHIMTGLAQLIQAWKGNQGANAAPDPFGEMFKQLGINIMQAGVDGIYKNVYDGYQPQPRNMSLTGQASPTQQGQPPNGQSVGFRR